MKDRYFPKRKGGGDCDKKVHGGSHRKCKL